MEVILWFVGFMAVWTGLKFVFKVFKRLGSADSMDSFIDKMEDGLNDAADSVATGFRNMKKQRKKKKEKPIVTIH